MKARNLAHIFYEWQGDELVINILGIPAAKRDVIGKVKGNQLKVSSRRAAGQQTTWWLFWQKSLE